ncbi:hypothetical protein AB4Z01_32245 [Inquilinus sp. YAF38]|uniref:hypothetical protein n=1 Tax=Inquilinus sp. YAF38 TaxID=3233084 RepID=UPI003F92F692
MTPVPMWLRCLGAHVGAVVEAVCCHEQDVRALSVRQGAAATVMGVLEDGLKTLADHYRLTGRDDPAPGGRGSRAAARPPAPGRGRAVTGSCPPASRRGTPSMSVDRGERP